MVWGSFWVEWKTLKPLGWAGVQKALDCEAWVQKSNDWMETSSRRVRATGVDGRRGGEAKARARPSSPLPSLRVLHGPCS